jgi:hypothetical protein
MVHFALEFLRLQVHLQDQKNVSVCAAIDQKSFSTTCTFHFHGEKLTQIKTKDNMVKYNGDNQQVRLDYMNV